ncbi:ankyrin repeat-containing protein BDA1-like [Durio zibethinus]|uniref:Ankyrin repeat-containing protein BDA1-like n=1 Tax=Durio zibethinus TaxID=66656 RepID=A0A6P6A8M8_DURZI|nr:ankyrin repeat-containing protein BDA1-like [Durio zibethinus]
MAEIHERLRGAAQAGNIDELYALIREDANVLEDIDQKPFFDTPLHIAAAAGHADFAIEIMNLKPSLALKLNPDGFSPIHLALQNGQKETILDLLGIDKDLLRVKGKGGKTPLHYVVGEAVDRHLLITFLLCCPECIRDVTNQNETALHIAAQNNLWEVFEVLVGWLRRIDNKDGKLWEKEVLNWKNKEGETVFHIAVSKNQPKMAKLLLESGIDKNAKNWGGLTAMDILQGQSQFRKSETFEILDYAGCVKASSIPINSTFDKFLRSKISFSEKSNLVMSRMRKNISNSTRNALLVVLVLILTATYQSAVNPPYDLGQAYLKQNNVFPAAIGVANDQPVDFGAPFPFDTPNNQPGNPFDTTNNQQGDSGTDLNDLIGFKLEPLAVSFSIFNAVDFLVTLLVTLFILPWVPYGQLLHVLLLLVFIFFVASMGLSLTLTTSNIGIGVFGVFVVVTIIIGIFIVNNKVRSKEFYRECMKEFGDRVRIRKHNDINKK